MERTRQIINLELAIKKREEAGRLSPTSHPDLAGRLEQPQASLRFPTVIVNRYSGQATSSDLKRG